jgi:hypothetical protein
MPEKRPPKRKRGGQPGNHNAHKHGLYAAGFTLEEMNLYFQALKDSRKDPAVDLIFKRVYAMLRRNLDKRRGLREALTALMRHYIAHEHPDHEETVKIREMYRTVLEVVQETELKSAMAGCTDDNRLRRSRQTSRNESSLQKGSFRHQRNESSLNSVFLHFHQPRRRRKVKS